MTIILPVEAASSFRGLLLLRQVLRRAHRGVLCTSIYIRRENLKIGSALPHSDCRATFRSQASMPVYVHLSSAAK